MKHALRLRENHNNQFVPTGTEASNIIDYTFLRPPKNNIFQATLDDGSFV